jgi:hypothetical protein
MVRTQGSILKSSCLRIHYDRVGIQITIFCTIAHLICYQSPFSMNANANKVTASKDVTRRQGK